ncbi:alpha/beta hydrolase-fold protein [Caulobacter sp. SSI4214]|uniref:alpha/beta hydrolase-fold protein n=1 Tax=Caulobacter sp. SSI4214 TaxID=2575739 RepID=UPI001F5118B8|nr:alpha/beta hydrolase-fold protein [Caulobacter sp. SSI4214]
MSASPVSGASTSGAVKPAPAKPFTIGIVVYPGADLLDIAGPHEVFAFFDGAVIGRSIQVATVGQTKAPTRTAGVLKIVPQYDFTDCPPIDLLFVPGGGDGLQDAIGDQALLDFLVARAAHASYVTSVCTGGLILASAGLLDGYLATTHWAFVEGLSRFPKVTIANGCPRWIKDRDRITGGGISSTIDESLFMVRTIVADLLTGPEAGAKADLAAQQVQLSLQYHPDPMFQGGDPCSVDFRSMGRSMPAWPAFDAWWTRRSKRGSGDGKVNGIVGVRSGLAKLWLGVVFGALVFGAAHAEDRAKPEGAPRFRNLPACTASPAVSACERPLAIERAESVVGAAPEQALNYALHGQTIDITFKAPDPDFAFGDAPYLCCDLQTYLKPVEPGLWGLSIDVPDLNAAVLELSVANLAGVPRPHRDFQGPDATHPLVSNKPGPVVPRRRTIDSRYLKSRRDIYEYRGRLCQRRLSRCKIVYLADGSSYAPFLSHVPSSAAQKILDHMVIIGIDNAGDDDQFGGKRMSELLAAAGDHAGFDAFERFVTEEVIPFVEQRPVSRKARSVGGWSNGGAWALSMALDHGELFSTALMFSNGALKLPSHPVATKDLKIKFGGGTLERSAKIFETDAHRIAELGPSVDEFYVVGGHSISTWNALFWWAITPSAPRSSAGTGSLTRASDD